MRRTLLLTNDFPPRSGGIQSYVHALARRLPADDLVVYAPAWQGAEDFDAAQPFPVVRHPTSLMLPVPQVARTAARLIREHRLSAVWFGATAPLALLAPALRRAGAERIVSSTHGHEVGWSMLPGSRQALRRIGSRVDVLTYISTYARNRIAGAFGPQAALERVAPGVDTERFRPDRAAGERIRERWGLAGRPVLVCLSRLVPRKGQDVLIEALPRIRAEVPDTALLIVGSGPDEQRLRILVERGGLGDAVVFTGAVEEHELPAHYLAGDAFAMPCRTRGNGLDVEGLGIVFLEASASGLPVVAGDSGGAPETVKPEQTGLVVDGRDVGAVAQACIRALVDPKTRSWGAQGRSWVRDDWDWQRSADRLAELIG
ncbi:glycosyltransferase family 4 protein [Nakamurella sp. A5-74]|uniref:phosphatidyl-myo-inositol dimannoside synthase n=1 Tax=Nakamurella sp. A5-74 TaxID=3158264 RepID=A0AAU8DL40_9ACTN